jgi:TonB family protein
MQTSNLQLLSDFNTRGISVIIGIGFTVSLFLFIPFISGITNENTQKPVLVFNSINLYKNIIVPIKRINKKPKPKIKKQKKKVLKKKPKIIKKENKTVVKKKKILDKLFATKDQKIEKIPEKPQIEEFPIPERIYNVDKKPQLLLGVQPIFPKDMKVLGKTAVVKVDALIDRYGKVRRAIIYKSAGKSFNDAAIKAVMASLFTPANIGGKPCAVVYRMSIKFNLK